MFYAAVSLARSAVRFRFPALAFLAPLDEK